MRSSRLAHIREEIRALYLSGLPIQRIAEDLGEPSYGAVQWIVRDITRSKSVAIAMGKPPKSMKRGACYARARTAARRYFGVSSSRQIHVHHKNGDITDNRKENLEILSVGDHNRHHHALRRARRAKTQ